MSLPRILSIVVFGLSAIFAPGAHAQTATWTKLATTSGTLTAGSACFADASGKDIVCPSDAPSLSGLSNPDRILSGTAGVYVSNTGIINFRTGGITTGYFSSSGLLVAPGISITTSHGISSTNGQFGNTTVAGIISAPNTSVTHTFGRLLISTGGTGNPVLSTSGSAIEFNSNLSFINNSTNFTATAATPFTFRLARANQPIIFNTSYNTTANYVEAMRLQPGSTGSSYVGIGGITPLAPLHVSGSSRITSWTIINANTTPTAALEVSGTVSATTLRLSSAATCATVADIGNHRSINGMLQGCRVE